MERIKAFQKFMWDKGQPAVLCFYFHPWEFEECKTEYHYGEGGVIVDDFIVKGTGDKATREFDRLCTLIKEDNAKVMRIDEFTDFWNETHK